MTNLFRGKEIKALSWKEPFATLMGHDKIETRSWSTNYRGLVLICSTLKEYDLDTLFSIAGREQFTRIMNTLPGEDDQGFLENRGHAIMVGNLVDCRPMRPKDEDACFVQYKPGLWCHVYEDVKRIEPIPFKGRQAKYYSFDLDRIKNLKYIK